jgi:hypothetical protein
MSNNITIFYSSGFIEYFSCSFSSNKLFNNRFAKLCNKFNLWSKNGCLLTEWNVDNIETEFFNVAKTVNAKLIFKEEGR